jgi:RNA polymerase sigma-70 factor (ECF subfamily)
MSDSEIIDQILKGDRDKYRILVERYQQMVFRTCIGFLHNKDDADDLTQDVFIQAFQSLSKFKGNASFLTWIYRIAVNASLNKVRRSNKKLFLQRFENILRGKRNEPEIPIPESENPENLMILDEQRKWVQIALNNLPENQRTAIILSKYDDLSQKEIAEILNLTEGAVEALLQRAKANLRNKLSSFRKKNKN